MRKFALMLVSTVGLTVCASAAMADAAASAPVPPAPAANQADLDKQVCRNMAPATGTRLGARRVCRTQREWDDIRLQSEKDTDKMQKPGMLAPGKT